MSGSNVKLILVGATLACICWILSIDFRHRQSSAIIFPRKTGSTSPPQAHRIIKDCMTSHPQALTTTNNRSAMLAGAFKPRMTTDEKAAALRCLAAFDTALRNASVTYFLYGGSLLGARRHRGIIPWDDDIDVLANYTQLSDIERSLRSVTGYELLAAHPNRYKFYARDGTPIRGKAWRWPYVDVCFFNENATHVYDNFPRLSVKYIYAKADVFPLAYRPFNNLTLPSPANEERVIARNYDEQKCQTNSFSHRDEKVLKARKITTVRCEELYSMYPFVFRNGTSNPIREVVKIGETVVCEYLIP